MALANAVVRLVVVLGLTIWCGAGGAADFGVQPQVEAPAGDDLIGPGYGPSDCLTTVLSGGLDLEFCTVEYHFENGPVFCSGLVDIVDGSYHLYRGACNSPGRVFPGGMIHCGRGYYCDWYPNRAARDQGFVTERVRVYWAEPARFRAKGRLRT